LEGAGGYRLSGWSCGKQSREEVDIGAGVGVNMWILEVSLVMMSDRRAASSAESLRMTKTKTVCGGSVVATSQRRVVVQTH
jgi:hypothetical protein